MKVIKQLQQFKKQIGGMSTLEFALLSPILMLMTMGTIELGLVMYATAVLEGATVTASRAGKPTDTRTIVESEVQRLSGGLLNAQEIKFNIIDSQLPTSGGQMVTYETTYEWDIITPFVSKFISDPFRIEVRVPSVVEPAQG